MFSFFSFEREKRRKSKATERTRRNLTTVHSVRVRVKSIITTRFSSHLTIITLLLSCSHSNAVPSFQNSCLLMLIRSGHHHNDSLSILVPHPRTHTRLLGLGHHRMSIGLLLLRVERGLQQPSSSKHTSWCAAIRVQTVSASCIELCSIASSSFMVEDRVLVNVAGTSRSIARR